MTQKIRLTSNEIQYMSLFQSITGATANDCIIDNERDRIILIVRPGNVGRAIGRHGSRIKMMQDMVQKDVEVVEYADNAIDFIKNSFAPARVKAVRITTRLDNKKVAVVTIDSRDKGIAIGKNGKTAERTRILARRYFQIDNVRIL